jgi:uncharacterized membrane protein YeaQ/YmgE (transglycosylase-associated protein family)
VDGIPGSLRHASNPDTSDDGLLEAVLVGVVRGPVSGRLQLPRFDESLVTGAMDAGAMRPALLGLIGAVLLVVLHAFLFASGEGHRSDPAPASSIAEYSAAGDGSGTALRSSIQAHDMADSCMPAIVGLGVLLLGLAGGRACHPAPVVLGAAAPVMAPPTPSPMALGISRS